MLGCWLIADNKQIFLNLPKAIDGEKIKQHLELTRDVLAQFNYFWTQPVLRCQNTYSLWKVRSDGVPDGWPHKVSKSDLRRWAGISIIDKFNKD